MKVILAPLDWGLGHTTRCIPLVAELLAMGHEVTLAAEGRCAVLLQQAFPQLPVVQLPGYRIRYSRRGWWQLPKIVLQVPKIAWRVWQEGRWLRHYADWFGIDLVISDNRFGFVHPRIPSLFITHQLRIPGGPAWMEALVQRVNYLFINRFSAVLVPDVEGSQALSGRLGHPRRKPDLPVHYIGWLSRMEAGAHNGATPLWTQLSEGRQPELVEGRDTYVSRNDATTQRTQLTGDGSQPEVLEGPRSALRQARGDNGLDSSQPELVEGQSELVSRKDAKGARAQGEVTEQEHAGPPEVVEGPTPTRHYDYLFMLSGPEPQRSLLEQKLVELARQLPQQRCFLLRALPGGEHLPSHLPPNLDAANHLGATALGSLIGRSRWILSRSGYTTLMEMMLLSKRMICIPTPGQTEQEYLGQWLHERGLAYSFAQSEPDYLHHLQQAEKFAYQLPGPAQNQLAVFRRVVEQVSQTAVATTEAPLATPGWA